MCVLTSIVDVDVAPLKDYFSNPFKQSPFLSFKRNLSFQSQNIWDNPNPSSAENFGINQDWRPNPLCNVCRWGSKPAKQSKVWAAFFALATCRAGRAGPGRRGPASKSVRLKTLRKECAHVLARRERLRQRLLLQPMAICRNREVRDKLLPLLVRRHAQLCLRADLPSPGSLSFSFSPLNTHTHKISLFYLNLPLSLTLSLSLFIPLPLSSLTDTFYLFLSNA